MRALRAPTQDQTGVLIAMMAVLFGGWVRLLIPWMAGFPINDGGLFYIMVRDLQADGLRLPLYVHYNGLSIPFAYPPLGFYAGAIAANVLRVDTIRILQWLPAAVSILAIPAIYLLAKTILGSSFGAGLAALLFAFTPRAITWQIMGGGLTRSFGELFLILALASVYQVFTGFTRTRLLLAILFSALVVLSHPEAALDAAGIALLFWLFVGRSRTSAVHAAAIGAGTLALSAIWWLPVVARYGTAPLLSAGQTGQHSLMALLEPFVLNLADEPLNTVIAALGVIGFAIQVSRNSLLIPIWFFAPFLIDPRSAPTYAMIPLALLASVGLGEAVLPAVAGRGPSVGGAFSDHPAVSRPGMIFLGLIGLYLLGQTAYFGSQIAATTLRPGDRLAFDWVRANTNPGSRFLLVTGGAEPFCDSTLEWFPALSERTSVTTIQGREWGDGQGYSRAMTSARSIADCVSSESPLACIESTSAAARGPLTFDYIFVVRATPIVRSCRAIAVNGATEKLIAELQQTPHYLQVYTAEDEAIFIRR